MKIGTKVKMLEDVTGIFGQEIFNKGKVYTVVGVRTSTICTYFLGTEHGGEFAPYNSTYKAVIASNTVGGRLL